MTGLDSRSHGDTQVYELSEGKWVDDLMFERSKPAAAGEAPGPLARIGHTVVYSEVGGVMRLPAKPLEYEQRALRHRQTSGTSHGQGRG